MLPVFDIQVCLTATDVLLIIKLVVFFSLRLLLYDWPDERWREKFGSLWMLNLYDQLMSHPHNRLRVYQ